jgi:hypothetical protein
MPPSADQIRTAILDVALRRGAGKSFCPSEPARMLGNGWRTLMPAVRAEAARMQDDGLIDAVQKNEPVRADAARGPIRLRLRAAGAAG